MRYSPEQSNLERIFMGQGIEAGRRTSRKLAALDDCDERLESAGGPSTAAVVGSMR